MKSYLHGEFHKLFTVKRHTGAWTRLNKKIYLKAVRKFQLFFFFIIIFALHTLKMHTTDTHSNISIIRLLLIKFFTSNSSSVKLIFFHSFVSHIKYYIKQQHSTAIARHTTKKILFNMNIKIHTWTHHQHSNDTSTRHDYTWLIMFNLWK